MSHPYDYQRHFLPPLHQGPSFDQRAVQPMYVRQQILMEEAIQIARQHVPGTVVEAELEREHGRLIFEVDIITAEGIRYEVEIDANSGEVLGISLD